MGQLRAAVVGATGYTGGELCRLLLTHPAVAAIVPAARDTAAEFTRVHPNLTGSGLEFTTVGDVIADAASFDVVFLCTPAGQSMELAPMLLAAGTRVVDLSADFRFPDTRDYERAYGRTHSAPEYQGEAVYGLPEWFRNQLGSARLVAGPGCYVTAALLALEPLLRTDLIDAAAPVHIAAVNGTTGAGNTPRPETQHATAGGTMLAYNLDGHRHAPEIDTYLTAATGRPVAVHLTTAHGSFARGIHLTATVPLASAGTTRGDVLDVWSDAYVREPFVHVIDTAPHGDRTGKDYRRYPTVAAVRGSNRCHLGADVDARSGVAHLVAVIDNLGKGAAGQAVQCMNAMSGINETAGLGAYGC